MSNPRRNVRICVSLFLLAAVSTGVYYLYIYKPGKKAGILLEHTGNEFHKEGALTFIDGETGADMLTIEIEKTETPDEQEIGLMYRRDVQTNHDILLSRKEDEEKDIWMTNTYINLNII